MPDRWGYVLECAAASGNESLVKWLIDEKGMVPDQAVLVWAAISGNDSLVKWLTDEKRIVPKQDVFWTAASSGNESLVKWLIDTKGMVTNERGHTMPNGTYVARYVAVRSRIWQ